MATDAAGNVLVAGKTTQSYYCCPSDAFVAKYSATGQSIWTRTLSLGQDGGAAGVAADAAGNVFIAGGTSAYPELGFAFVAKYNAGGQLLWTRTLGSGSSGLGAATDPTGNILIAGETSSSLQGLPDAFVAKYSPAGKLMWTRQLGTPEGDVAGGVATDIVGNVVIGGWTGGSLGGSEPGR